MYSTNIKIPREGFVEITCGDDVNKRVIGFVGKLDARKMAWAQIILEKALKELETL